MGGVSRFQDFKISRFQDLTSPPLPCPACSFDDVADDVADDVPPPTPPACSLDLLKLRFLSACISLESKAASATSPGDSLGVACLQGVEPRVIHPYMVIINWVQALVQALLVQALLVQALLVQVWVGLSYKGRRPR